LCDVFGISTMTIWMVTGLHDARWAANALENLRRQEHADKRLIIVENGAGIGAADSLYLGKQCVKLTSDGGPAAPLNTALAWLRANASPDDWFAKCDADDYYGPGYLNAIEPAIRSGAAYCGRSSLYIKTTDDRLWFAEGYANSTGFHGPTIAARIGSSVNFPSVRDWGEDALWCIEMHKASMRPMTLPPEHFCYQRHAGYHHTWPCTDLELRTSWSVRFTDLGPVDYDVVDGLIPRPVGTILDILGADIDNQMAVRVLKERMRGNMKKITVPKHTIEGPEGAVGIDWFIVWLLNTDREFNADGAAIRSAARIESALRVSTIGDSSELHVEEQDYERLRRASESPSAGTYPANPARAVLPWVEAIASAS
jgi:glycosyltransferase involved in cell wall biosynthesis